MSQPRLSQNQYIGKERDLFSTHIPGSSYIAIDTNKFFSYDESGLPILMSSAKAALAVSSINGNTPDNSGNINIQSPFTEVLSGTPNFNPTLDAFRTGKLGLGEPNPVETLDIIGSLKSSYTYSDGSIARTTLGGENTNSEIGVPSGLIKTNTIAFIPEAATHPGMQAYSYVGDLSTLVPSVGKVSAGFGVANFTNTKGATLTALPVPNNGNVNDEYALTLSALHEDGSTANIQLWNRGTGGFSSEPVITSRVSEGTESNRTDITPHTTTLGGLLRLSKYTTGALKPGDTHTDGVTLGVAVNNLSTDANGYFVQTPLNSGLERITEGGNSGWSFIGANRTNFGNIGNDAIDFGLYNALSGQGATGDNSLNHGSDNIASGFNAITLGFNNRATNNWSTAIGNSLTVGGVSNVAFGAESTMIAGGSTTGYSIMTGRANEHRGVGGSTFGLGLLNRSIGTCVVGTANETYSINNSNPNLTSDPVFIVGNGTVNAGTFVATNRSDAFRILKNGQITAPSTDISDVNSGGIKSIVTKEYLDRRINTIKVTLTPAQLMTLGTTPIEAIAAPGAGFIINVINATGRLTFGSSPYSDNEISITGFGIFDASFIESTSSNLTRAGHTPDTTLNENSAILIGGTDSLLTGDSNIDFYLTYETLEL